ncbi:MAG: tetratricopeptide repeat protein [Bacteroidota bacterium]|nr:tetratricopeptide repeat protein [Bacteroidota bacterium]
MKRNILFVCLILFAGLFVSTPLSAQEDVDISNLPKYGNDSSTAIMKISLYREFYKQWKGSGYKSNSINDALESWRWLYDNAPLSTENMYLDGIKMYNFKIGKVKDDAVKESLIDTLMGIYDKRITYFPVNRRTQKSQIGKILGYKGVDLYQKRPGAIKEVYDIFEKSVKIQGNKSQSAVLVYFFRATIQKVKEGCANKILIIENYDMITQIIDHNIKKYAGKKRYLAMWKNVQGNIENTFEPYATCEDLCSIFQTKFDEISDDVELLEKITGTLDKKGCSGTELFFAATEKLHSIQPTANSAEKMGKMLIKKNDYIGATKYLEEAVNLFTDELDKAGVYKLLANIFYTKSEYVKARKYAYKALEIIPKDGSIYITIGDMYAASAKSCGSNDLTSKVAYWAAVDKYMKAKRIDSTVADEAAQRIIKYSQYFPNAETIFFYDLSEGDSYVVESWINETTKVRTVK